MTWLPISGTLPQFTTDGEQANGYVLKFYEIGTTTPLTVSSSNTGTPTTTDFLLDTEGYTTLSAVRVIPHVQTGYKLICYLNQTDADANDTGSAVWSIDSITLASTGGSVTGADNVAQLATVNTTFFQTAIVKGTTNIDDGGQATFYFDSSSTDTPNGSTIIAPNTGTGRWLILNVETLALGDRSVTEPKIGFVPTSVYTGLVVSNNAVDSANDVDVSAGTVGASDNSRYLSLPSAFTKELDLAFAVGTGLGGRSSLDTHIANTLYGVYLIGKEDGTTDIILATSQSNALNDTTANSAGFIYARVIAYFQTGGNIVTDDLVITPALGSKVTTRIYTSSATYIPAPSVNFLTIQTIGGGGGGGGVDGQGGTTIGCSIAGGGGGYCYNATGVIDSSYTIVIGTGGTAGASGNNDGGAGVASTISSTSLTVSAGGGGGGVGVTGSENSDTEAYSDMVGASGGTSTGGDINVKGSDSTSSGWSDDSPDDAVLVSMSVSGSSLFGGDVRASANATGVTATSYGAGGGAATSDTSSNYAGGAGAAGVVIITESIV